METLDTRIGIANIGNTCFLNVVLQSLRLCPAITELFLTDDISLRDESKKKQLTSGLQTLIRDFWRNAPGVSDSPVLVPRGFLQALKSTLATCDDDWWRPGQQSDAAEALQYIIESIHDSMYRQVNMNIVGDVKSGEEAAQIKSIKSWIEYYRKEYSPIIGQFYGQTLMRIRCSVCDTCSERFEPWFMIKAPIPGSDIPGGKVPDLEECILSAFEDEDLSDYACDTCKAKVAAKMSTGITHFPTFLCVSIKRFTNRNQKVRGRIEWDLDNMDFKKVSAFDRDPMGNKNFSTQYTTVSVIEHMGSAQGGHYVMYNRQNDKWYKYDDNSVSTATPDEVINPDSYVAIMVPTNVKDDLYSKQKKLIETWREAQH